MTQKEQKPQSKVSRRNFVKALLGAVGLGVPTLGVSAANNGRRSALVPSPDAPDGDEVTYVEATDTANQVPLHVKQLDTTNNPAAIRITNAGSGLDIQSMNAGVIGAGSFAFMTKNGSGGAVSAGDVGFIDIDGKFVKSAAEEFALVNWCVAMTDAADNADIYVARRGRLNVAYTGSAPSAGDYLVTSNTAGRAQAQSSMRPEVFGVCLEAGSGGLVPALLLTQRNVKPASSDSDIFRINYHSGTLFTGTIAAVYATQVEYVVTEGYEDSIRPHKVDHLAKLVLHNLDDGGSTALVDHVLLDDQATPSDGRITFIGSTPAGWQVGDTITANSQTNLSTLDGVKWFDFDLNHADNTIVPPDAVGLAGEMSFIESAPAIRLLLQPFEPDDEAKRRGYTSNQSTFHTLRGIFEVSLVDRKFQVLCGASGVATALALWRVSQIVIAEP